MTFMQICVLFGVNQSAHLLNLNFFFKKKKKSWKVVEFLCSNMYNLCDSECNSDLLALNLTQLGG